MKDSQLEAFMNDVLNLQVHDFGGAGAGIAGISSSGDVLLLDFKQTVAAFAREYARPGADNTASAGLGEKIKAQLLTLEVANVISHAEAARLTKNLEDLY